MDEIYDGDGLSIDFSFIENLFRNSDEPKISKDQKPTVEWDPTSDYGPYEQSDQFLHPNPSKEEEEKPQPKNKEKKRVRILSEGDQPENFVLLKRRSDRQNKNTPRFLVRLAVKYLKAYKNQYPPEIYKIVKEECQKLQKWNLAEKNNVYLINHLKYLFTEKEVFTEEGTKINRKVFRKVLLNYARKQMLQPKSQVKKNRLEYFKSCKIFLLRCMSESLVGRNQTK